MLTAQERFWSKVQRGEGCWLWTGARTRFGYGVFSPVRTKQVHAHRFAYEAEVGPIPDGYQVDHLCHSSSDCTGGWSCPHRACVNPSHLEAVSPKENTDRSLKNHLTHHYATRDVCSAGHPYAVYGKPYPGRPEWRRCGECQRIRDRKYYAATHHR